LHLLPLGANMGGRTFFEVLTIGVWLSSTVLPRQQHNAIERSSSNTAVPAAPPAMNNIIRVIWIPKISKTTSSSSDSGASTTIKAKLGVSISTIETPSTELAVLLSAVYPLRVLMAELATVSVGVVTVLMTVTDAAKRVMLTEEIGTLRAAASLFLYATAGKFSMVPATVIRTEI